MLWCRLLPSLVCSWQYYHWGHFNRDHLFLARHWQVDGAQCLSAIIPVIQGGVLLIATMVIGVNMLVDMTYALIDPKLGSGGHS